MANLSKYVVQLEAETAKYQRKLDQANRKLSNFERNNKRSLQNIQRSFKQFGAALGVIGISQAVRGIAQAGIEMQRLERGLRVASGSAQGAAKEMAFLRSEAGRLGLDLRTSGAAFVSLSAAAKGTSLEGNQVREIFTSISEASRVMGLSTEQTKGALVAIEQIISKGKVSAEELRGQLGERLPGAFQIAARSIGKTTEELDDMLRKGELSANDLLPALAKELRKTFGSEVEDAANDAQAAFARFSTAVFELKVAIAESGVLDALASLSRGLTFFLQDDSGFGAKSDAFEAPIKHLRQLRARLEAQIKGLRAGAGQNGGLLGDLLNKFRDTPSIENLESQLDSVTAALERMKAAQLEVLTGGGSGDELSTIFTTAKHHASDYAEELEKINKKYRTAQQETDELRAVLARFRDDLSPETIALIMEDIQETWSGGLEEIVITTKRRFTKPVKDEIDLIREATKQAARDMQSAFAEFLFDPFEDGLKGMVKGFLDAIRRMLANQAAIRFFKFIKGVFGGENPEGIDVPSTPEKRAMGGPVSGGAPYLIGERGPELFVPGANGTVIPNHQLSGGGVTVVNHNNFSGADSGLIRQMPALLERTKQDTIRTIMQMQDTRRAIA